MTPDRLAAAFTAIQTADGWHRLRTPDGRTLAAEVRLQDGVAVALAIPAGQKPPRLIVAALRQHVADENDGGQSPTIARYLERKADGWIPSEDGTERLLDLRPYPEPLRAAR